jgi:hypothetical protein
VVVVVVVGTMTMMETVVMVMVMGTMTSTRLCDFVTRRWLHAAVLCDINAHCESGEST